MGRRGEGEALMVEGVIVWEYHRKAGAGSVEVRSPPYSKG